jgi:hypothetical protein
MNIRTAAAPISAVATQPMTTMGLLAVNGPITARLETRRIITATTSLITALQNSANPIPRHALRIKVFYPSYPPTIGH